MVLRACRFAWGVRSVPSVILVVTSESGTLGASVEGLVDQALPQHWTVASASAAQVSWFCAATAVAVEIPETECTHGFQHAIDCVQRAAHSPVQQTARLLRIMDLVAH